MCVAQMLAVYRTIRLPVPAESLGLWSVHHSLVFDVGSSIWGVEAVFSLAAPSVVVRLQEGYWAARLRARFLSLGLRPLTPDAFQLPQNSL